MSSVFLLARPLRWITESCLLWVLTSRFLSTMSNDYLHMEIYSCASARMCPTFFPVLMYHSLQALKTISQEQPTACLHAGALMAVLSYLDLFSTTVQVARGGIDDDIRNYVSGDNDVNGAKKNDNIATQGKLKNVNFGDVSVNTKCKLLH